MMGLGHETILIPHFQQLIAESSDVEQNVRHECAEMTVRDTSW